MPEALNYVRPYYHLKVADAEINEMKNFINRKVGYNPPSAHTFRDIKKNKWFYKGGFILS